MKTYTYLVAAALGLAASAPAMADVTVKITGSTAFRKSAITGIEKLMIAGPGNVGAGIPAGNFKAAYDGAAAAGNEQGSTYAIFQGTITGIPGVVTVTCAWSGSTGGLITTSGQYNISNTNTGFLTTANLTGGFVNTVGAAGIVGGAATFGPGTDKPDITFGDSHQESVGLSNLVQLGTSGNPCGVIPFEWVVNNAVTAPVTFTTTNAIPASTVNPVFTYASGAGVFNKTGAAATAVQANAVNIIGGDANLPRNAACVVNDAAGTITVTGTTGTSAIPAGTKLTAAVSATNAITKINQDRAVAILTSGVSFLSDFTGNSADFTVAVYAAGRNFDSGTRLSCLAETGIGYLGTVNAHMQPAFVGGTAYGAQVFPNKGKGGGANKYIATLDQWSAETLYPAIPAATRSFALGQGGFNGGGDLADFLATPGSVGAVATSPATQPLYNGVFSGAAANGGILIGYLGRNDAARASKTTSGANTAHQILWNGERDWLVATPASTDYVNSDLKADGTPVLGYDDAKIQEGNYTAWEFEFVYGKNGIAGDLKSVGDKLANQIETVDGGSAGILFGSMNVTRSTEGGVIGHN